MAQLDFTILGYILYTNIVLYYTTGYILYTSTVLYYTTGYI